MYLHLKYQVPPTAKLAKLRTDTTFVLSPPLAIIIIIETWQPEEQWWQKAYRIVCADFAFE